MSPLGDVLRAHYSYITHEVILSLVDILSIRVPVWQRFICNLSSARLVRAGARTARLVVWAAAPPALPLSLLRCTIMHSTHYIRLELGLCAPISTPETLQQPDHQLFHTITPRDVSPN